MSNFLIFKAAFNNSATPAIGTYTAEGATAQFTQNASLSPDYYLYNATDGTAVQWFVPTKETTDFEFVADILTTEFGGYFTYFIIADSTGTTRLRMWSLNNFVYFANDDSNAQTGTQYIGALSNDDIGGFEVFHRFRVRVRKLTASSSSVEVYVDGTLKLTATAGAALVTCAKIGFTGGVNDSVPLGTYTGIQNTYLYDLSDGDVVNPGVLSGAFNRFISWMKSKFALKSDIPTVNNATLTIQKNGTNVATFTANASANATANIQCVDLTSNQTVGGDKEFTGTTTAHDLVPSTTDTYNFGSSSYQWNKVYSKEYYYNGTAWGLDKANTWTAQQKYTGNNACGVLSIYNSSYTKGSTISATELSIGTIFLGDGGNTGLGKSLGLISCDLAATGNRSMLSFSAIKNEALSSDRTNLIIEYDKSDTTSPEKIKCKGTVLPNSNSTYNLGTSTNKWKTFNGINPGALSLPSTSSGINLDLTNFKLDGSDNKFSLTNFSNYPYDNGWLFVRLDGCIYYYLDHWYKVVSNAYANSSTAIFFLPITDIDHDITLRCVCTSINYIRVFPCQGNV